MFERELHEGLSNAVFSGLYRHHVTIRLRAHLYEKPVEGQVSTIAAQLAELGIAGLYALSFASVNGAGLPHLHCIMSAPPPAHWIESYCTSYGSARAVHCRELRHTRDKQNVVNYISRQSVSITASGPTTSPRSIQSEPDEVAEATTGARDVLGCPSSVRAEGASLALGGLALVDELHRPRPPPGAQ